MRARRASSPKSRMVSYIYIYVHIYIGLHEVGSDAMSV